MYRGDLVDANWQRRHAPSACVLAVEELGKSFEALIEYFLMAFETPAMLEERKPFSQKTQSQHAIDQSTLTSRMARQCPCESGYMRRNV